MKRFIRPMVLAIACLPSVGLAQEAQPSASPARVPGAISDGTPPPPAPPKPGFTVRPGEILDTRTHTQDGREITVREITPVQLPPPPSPAPVVEISEAFRARAAEFRRTRAEGKFLAAGAMVYHSKDFGARSLVHIMQRDGGEPVVFWTSADFSLLSGFAEFIGSDGETRSFMMQWGIQNIDRAKALSVRHGRQYQPPTIPTFSEGKATFAIVSGEPSAETLLSIQSLTDLYNNELPRLKAAAESREAARLRQEAELKANPPQPKDIVIDYWLTDSANEAPEKGAAR